ncbi:MAG: transthyretin-like family protein [Bacteroidales bacterium]|nr:transthyretin-like family protein [Bacteroidales bacterium]
MFVVRFLVLLLALSVVSCGGPARVEVFPTEGKLLLHGKPVGNVTVFFIPVDNTNPDAVRAYATTKPDGSFSLTTFDAYDGAPAGEYIVTLLYEPLTSALTRAKSKPVVIDKKFANPATSPLRATVAKSPKNVLEPIDAK